MRRWEKEGSGKAGKDEGEKMGRCEGGRKKEVGGRNAEVGKRTRAEVLGICLEAMKHPPFNLTPYTIYPIPFTLYLEP